MPLAALSQRPDYRFAEEMLDVRGWKVKTLVDNQALGDVHDMLLDPAGRPRYLDVEVGLFRKHVLLPIGQARLDRDSRVVWVPGLTGERFEHIPEYRHDLRELDRGEEATLMAAYAGAYSGEDTHLRPPWAGALYGPSVLEARVRAEAPPRFARLSGLDDFRIAEGNADPRRWAVHGADDRAIGQVEDLLVDTRALKARYVVCEVDEHALDLEPQRRRVLVPVGFVRLDPARRVALVDRITARAVAEMPLYTGQELTRELEHDVLDLYGPDDDGGFYDDPRFDPRGFYGPAAA